MFGRSRPVTLESYGRRRSRPLMPRWLLLLLLGAALGIGGVIYVQEELLPPRLSAEASARLQSSYDQAEAERQRLGRELTETTQRLESTLAQQKRQADELATSRQTVEQLRSDITALVDALPPDPRGNTVEVRAARFVAQEGQLQYEVILTRDNAGGKPMTGVVQFVVAGESARGSETTVALDPVALTLGRYESLRGSVALPEGFRARQTTINVLDRPDGRRLGMRVYFVR